MINFSNFIKNVIIESLHPELQAIATKSTRGVSKQTQLANKIRDLTSRGEKTGIEGNMPKGSSRAYLQHEEPEKLHIDGKPASMRVGTKVAIKAALDAHHKGDMPLGNMQNKAENGDWWANKTYRTLTEH